MSKTQRMPHCDKSDCPVAHATDIVGDPWSLLIIRDMLILGKHEYKEFMQSPEGISTNVLANRLKKLVCADLIEWINHPEYKTRKLYYLTPAGKDFIHVIVALASWADRNMDSVSLPPEMAEKLRNNPQGIIENALRALTEWEEKYLQQS